MFSTPGTGGAEQQIGHLTHDTVVGRTVGAVYALPRLRNGLRIHRRCAAFDAFVG